MAGREIRRRPGSGTNMIVNITLILMNQIGNFISRSETSFGSESFAAYFRTVQNLIPIRNRDGSRKTLSPLPDGRFEQRGGVTRAHEAAPCSVNESALQRGPGTLQPA